MPAILNCMDKKMTLSDPARAMCKVSIILYDASGEKNSKTNRFTHMETNQLEDSSTC